jgi:hypothetical protein
MNNLMPDAQILRTAKFREKGRKCRNKVQNTTTIIIIIIIIAVSYFGNCRLGNKTPDQLATFVSSYYSTTDYTVFSGNGC